MAWMITAFLGATLASAPAPVCPPDGQPPAAREVMRELVAFRTVAGQGQVPAMADYLEGLFRCAGFDAADIERYPVDDTLGLVVRYRAAGEPVTAPVLFLAHMDVVNANPDEWSHDPWTLVEVDGYLQGRGVVDNKYGLLTVVEAFTRLQREGFTPDRDLVAVFTGDEESTMHSTRLLADALKGAAFAINSDAGGGYRAANGQGAYYLQAAEKTYATFEVTARNPGGHSSKPRPDNAIYALSNALARLATFRFPVNWNAVTLGAFAGSAPLMEGELAEAVEAFVANPGDPVAVALMEREPDVDRELRTTCVATKLAAGDAENALPTFATATVNCRIFPGETVASVQGTLASALADPALELRVLGEPVESPASEVPAELQVALEKLLAQRAPGASITPYMESGGTDGLHFRRVGIPTLGIGPLISDGHVEYGYHGVNERIPVSQFEEGLGHFETLIRALAGNE